MKTLYILAGLIFFFTVSCKKEILTTDNLPLNQSVELKKGLVKSNLQEGIRITLDSVINDSRCAMDVVCVWEGNAEAYFTCCMDENEKTGFVLNSNPSFINDTLISGYRIKLLDLKPYPLSDKIIKPDEYTAEISVSKE